MRKGIFLLGMILILCSITNGQEKDDLVWNLKHLYEDSISWEDDQVDLSNRIQNAIKELDNPLSGPKQLYNVLEDWLSIMNCARRIELYGTLVYEQENDGKYADKYLRKGREVLTNAEANLQILFGNLDQIDIEILSEWMRQNPDLEKYQALINRLIDTKPYRVNAEADAVMKKWDRWRDQPYESYAALMQMENYWPIIKLEDGTEISATRSAFRRARRSDNRNEREAIIQAHHEGLMGMKDILAKLYCNKVEAEMEKAKLQGFDNPMDASWFWDDGMPKGTYEVMLTTARKNRDILWKYSNLRKSIYNLDTLKFFDLFLTHPSLGNLNVDLSSTLEIAYQVGEKVGGKFSASMDSLFKLELLHLQPAPNKTNYHIHPGIGDAPPYMILNYAERFNVARACVGGLFDMTTDFINQKNAPHTDLGSYRTHIYGNAMIYVGDILYNEYMVEKCSTKDEKIAVLLESIQFFQYHYWKWIIGTEFDNWVQQELLKGNQPDGDAFNNKYLELLKYYYGGENGQMEIDPSYGIYWATNSPVPFMRGFDHQHWPAAIIAATNIVEGINKEDESIKKAILRNPLDRYHTHAFLLNAKIDLTKPSIHQNALDYMYRILAELELLLEIEH